MITNQVYENEEGERNTDFIKVLPRVLHVDLSFVASRFDESRRTLFKECSVVPLGKVVPSSSREIWHCRHGREDTKVSLLSSLRRCLKDTIYERWNPEYYHVVLHSSGYDSRMISWTIKELYEEHGSEWLGRILFLCSKWEGREFKRIMEYEGWDDSQYHVTREDVPDQHYYERSLLDFSSAYSWSNGASAIPVNLFWYPIQFAQEDGLLPPGNIQLFTGQWGNTYSDAGARRDSNEIIKKTWKMFYWSVLFARPMKGDVIVHPFASDDYGRIVASSSTSPSLGKQLRVELVKSMDEHLASFTNMNSDGDRHQRIADSIIDKMVEGYDRSWYGKKVHARPKFKTTEFQPFWSRWTAASLCEYLLQNGCDIRTV